MPGTTTVDLQLACGTCGRHATELVELAPDCDLYAARCADHVVEPPNHKREHFYTARGTKPLGLTKEERKAAFAGTLNRLRRKQKPDQEAKEKIIVSWTKGGRQIVDYDTGETVYIPRQPRLWLSVKGWHLKAGSTEWETEVELIDRREQNRVLANGVGGMPRESGLKTRWGESVSSDGSVRDRDVPTRDEQHENWTPETERGYGGRNELEHCEFTGTRVPATGVDDAYLKQFSDEAVEKNAGLRLQQRERERKMREEYKLVRENRRGNIAAARAAKQRVESAERRIAENPSAKALDSAAGSDLGTPAESPAAAA